MSRVSSTINLLHNRLDDISGLEGEFTIKKLKQIYDIIDEIEKHEIESPENGTVWERS